jgi:hypothetical protein
MHARRRVHALLAALATVAALVPAVAAGGSTENNKAAASAEADALLAAAALPDGVTALTAEPDGDSGLLAGPPTIGSNPNTALRTAFFRTSLSPADVLAFTDAHAPAGASTRISGGGDGRTGNGVEFRGYMRPRLRSVLGNRWLLVSATTLDDGATGIRVDAQVVWLDARPANQVIPARARHLTITARGRRTLRIADPERVQRIAQMLNGLDVYQPDLFSCERAYPGAAQPRLTFRARPGARPLAVVHIHPSGCSSADGQIDGKQMLALDLRFEPGPRLLKALKGLSAF